MRFLNQFRRLRFDDGIHFVEKGLRARLQRGVRGQRHLACNHLRSGAQSCPVVVGQPQRHLDLENIEQLDEVVGPAGRNRARTHGIFQREVPADDPGEQLTQRGIGIGVSAARQRNHRGKFRVAKPRKSAPQPR